MSNRRSVHFARVHRLPVEEYRRVLMDAGMSAAWPVDDAERLENMLSAANLIVPARLDRPDGPLVGVARCITDFAWCCYLSELAVTASARGLGVGRGILDEARRHLGPRVSLILASVPDAAAFYERVGMTSLPHCFWFRREY